MTTHYRAGDLEPGMPLSNIGNRFHVIFDAVKDGIFISDPVTGAFIDVNEPGCALYGYSKDELIGLDIKALSSGVAPYTQDVAIEKARKAMLGEAQTFEWHCITKAGVLFWTEISIRYAKIGPIPAVIAIVRDISERKALDEQLNSALAVASAASEAKSAFLANMSHELRTPLNAVLGFSELMMTMPLNETRIRDYAADIHKSGHRLLSLINDILDLSRLDVGKTALIESVVSLDRVLKGASETVRLQAERGGIRMAPGATGHLPAVLADERRIKQIVVNLLSNAIKFTPENGVVMLNAVADEMGVSIAVTDTGIGIAAADLPKVLERFGQADSRLCRKFEGSGLGLPLAKQLIELHGGTLAVASQVGVGTTVTVTIPSSRIVLTPLSHAA